MHKVRVNNLDYEVQGLPELQSWLKEGRVQLDTPVFDPADETWKTVSLVLRPPCGAAPPALKSMNPPNSSHAKSLPQTTRAIQVQQTKVNSGQGSGDNVVAALCSFFIPGLGQLLQGRIRKAFWYFTDFLILVVLSYLSILSGSIWVVLFVWGFFIINWIASIIDAARFKAGQGSP